MTAAQPGNFALQRAPGVNIFGMHTKLGTLAGLVCSLAWLSGGCGGTDDFRHRGTGGSGLGVGSGGRTTGTGGTTGAAGTPGATGGSAQVGTQVGTIGGCQIFPADNPWNQDISSL